MKKMKMMIMGLAAVGTVFAFGASGMAGELETEETDELVLIEQEEDTRTLDEYDGGFQAMGGHPVPRP